LQIVNWNIHTVNGQALHSFLKLVLIIRRMNPALLFVARCVSS
jgi:hypothetical protein